MERVPITGMCEISVPISTLIIVFERDFKGYSRLLIKTAILMPEAQDGEVTIVEVETLGYNKTRVIGVIDELLLQLTQVKLPIVAMKGGADLQKYVDVLLPSAPATIKIVQVKQYY